MNNSTPLPPAARTERPWGWFETLCQGPGSKTKRIHVHAGRQISLQKHLHRSEHWVVVLGEAWVTLDDRQFALACGQHCEIACGQVHRLANRTSVGLEIVEVQLGSVLDENDIVRLQDDYGRR